MFGEGNGNWQKNELYDNVKMYFRDGGTVEGLFDVVHTAYEFEDIPSVNLEQEIQQLKHEVEIRKEAYNSIQERIDRAVAVLKGEE